MYWGGNLISVIHMLPDSYGAVIALRFRNMRILSSSAHRYSAVGHTVSSNLLFSKPSSSWKKRNADLVEPKSHMPSTWPPSGSRIGECHALQCRQVLLSNGCVRDVSAAKWAVGLSRVLVWPLVAKRSPDGQSLRRSATSTKDDCGNHSTSPSSSMYCENLSHDDGKGGGEEAEEVSFGDTEDDDRLEGDEMQWAEDDPRLWDMKAKTKEELKSGLYLVGTPIGNLEDITLRALRILQSATCILAEDTRHSSKLLQHYGISTPTMSYHKFNEHSRRAELIQRLQRGEVLALISDAGMPGISDPGSELVKACVEENLKVFPIPGPSAALTALVASGLPTEEFSFVGFLSAQASARQKRLSAAAKESPTQIFYVPPHKLCRVLDDCISAFGPSRRCTIAREMTKLHEEFWRSTLEEAKVEFGVRQPRGELTLIVEGLSEGAGLQQNTKQELMSRLKILMDAGKGPSEASKLVVQETSARRNVVYALALEISKGST